MLSLVLVFLKYQDKLSGGLTTVVFVFVEYFDNLSSCLPEIQLPIYVPKMP
jgi:hypothetical protein